MHLPDPQQVNHWIQNGGPPVLFGLLFACGLGLPLPEDIPLITAGAMIATGRMHPVVAAVCAWLGIIGGDCVLYHLGKAFGMEITRVPVIGRHVTRERLEAVERRFDKHGVWVVAVGRLFAGIRGAMVVCAGAIRFPFWKFLIADGLAAIVSGGLFMLLGYWFGNQMEKLQGHVHAVKRWTLVGAVTLVVAVAAWWLISQRRRRTHGHQGGAPEPPPEAPEQPASDTSADAAAK